MPNTRRAARPAEPGKLPRGAEPGDCRPHLHHGASQPQQDGQWPTHSYFCDGDSRELERTAQLGGPVLLGWGLPATPPVTVACSVFLLCISVLASGNERRRRVSPKLPLAQRLCKRLSFPAGSTRVSTCPSFPHSTRTPGCQPLGVQQ